jgi:hypothetical protein
VRPEGLDVERRGVLFPYRTRQKWRVFFLFAKRHAMRDVLLLTDMRGKTTGDCRSCGGKVSLLVLLGVGRGRRACPALLCDAVNWRAVRRVNGQTSLELLYRCLLT